MDDILVTGGTANAACDLVLALQAEVVACEFIAEIKDINDRRKHKNIYFRSFITFDNEKTKQTDTFKKTTV